MKERNVFGFVLDDNCFYFVKFHLGNFFHLTILNSKKLLILYNKFILSNFFIFDFNLKDVH